MKLNARTATTNDASELVDFVLMAGEGLPDLAWAEMAEEGESTRDVGLRRASREEGSFSFTNASIFEHENKPVGGLVGYKLPDTPVEIGPDFPTAYVPLQQLENRASGSWYVNILGVYPHFRGKGVGSAMLEHAEVLARTSGATGLSIIVFSANPGAERLYRRHGYMEAERRKMDYPKWRHHGCDAILLIKDFK